MIRYDPLIQGPNLYRNPVQLVRYVSLQNSAWPFCSVYHQPLPQRDCKMPSISWIYFDRLALKVRFTQWNGTKIESVSKHPVSVLKAECSIVSICTGTKRSPMQKAQWSVSTEPFLEAVISLLLSSKTSCMARGSAQDKASTKRLRVADLVIFSRTIWFICYWCVAIMLKA